MRLNDINYIKLYTGTKFKPRNCGGVIMSHSGAPYDFTTKSSELRGPKHFSFRGSFKLSTYY